MCAVPIERFKDSYVNHRWNPFTGADMAVDKEEDHLFIPSGSPFVVQLLEVPRKNTPSSITVYCYDDEAYFTEVFTTPTQGEFRVDYPEPNGHGTGLIEFNQNDANKEIRVNYKATGSPIVSEFLDTKVSYPAGNPENNQIIGFVNGVPDWRNNPVCYFHEGSVLYNASGENESCLLIRFKRSAKQSKVFLELKGAKLHQGYYTELKEHLHEKGTLAGTQPSHTHSVSGQTAGAGEMGGHTHGAGTLVGSQPSHTHAVAGDTGDQSVSHTHSVSGDSGNTDLSHKHDPGTLSGSQPKHKHVYTPGYETPAYTSLSGDDAVTISGQTANWNISNLHKHSISLTSSIQSASHKHAISFTSGAGGNQAVTITGETAEGGAGESHNHSINLVTGAGGADAITITGNMATAGGSPKTYPDSLKIYLDGVNKTSSFLSKSGLDKLGDGTASHPFVTTGSGEVDISDWITTPGIKELKITEPINGKGGRVLVHIECY